MRPMTRDEYRRLRKDLPEARTLAAKNIRDIRVLLTEADVALFTPLNGPTPITRLKIAHLRIEERRGHLRWRVIGVQT